MQHNIDKIVLANAVDKMRECEDKNILTHTAFLTLEEQSYFLEFFKKQKSDSNFFLYGGYENSERQILLFLPDYFSIDTQSELYDFFSKNSDINPVSLLHFGKDSFSVATHRDYLGALMALGIKREMIGDIIVKDDSAQIYAVSKISDYILENLKSAGRATLHGKYISIDSKSEQVNRFEEKHITVSSLRLDNIISGCYNLSRGNASQSIENGLIYVNNELKIKPDFKVNENDKIVYRGKGKIILSQVLGKSKKDKFRVLINYYK